MRLGLFGLGICSGVCLMIACGGAIGSFPYKYYSMDLPADCYSDGKLQGKSGAGGWPGLSMSECQPDKGNKLKCIVVLDSDFYAAKDSFLRCQQDLIECQKNAK